MTTVARISVSQVKGFRLRHPEEVQLESDGVPGNRRFFVIGSDGERIRTAAGTLELEGAVVEGPWEKPLSAVAGEAVRLVRSDRLDSVANAPATLVSDDRSHGSWPPQASTPWTHDASACSSSSPAAGPTRRTSGRVDGLRSGRR
jgi:hypothetical protein